MSPDPAHSRAPRRAARSARVMALATLALAPATLTPACATRPTPAPGPAVVHARPHEGHGDAEALRLTTDALAAFEAGRHAEALALADRALAVRPFGLAAGLARVESLLALGHRAEARLYAERLRDAHPRRVEAHSAFGKALFALGRFAEARDAFDAGLDLAPDDFHAGLGLLACMALDARLDASTTGALADRLLAAHPEDADVLHELAIAAETRGEVPAAEALYRRALAARPHHPFAHYNLARLLHHRDGLGAARANYLSFLEQAPKSALSEKESVETLLEKEAP